MSDSWQELLQCKRLDSKTPQKHFGPIASGDKVITLSSVVNRYRQVWSELIGVEMEAGGVAAAAFGSSETPGFFMVRCASDLADADKDSANVKKWRPYACDAAASFAVAFLRSGPVTLSGGSAGGPVSDPPPASSPPQTINVTVSGSGSVAVGPGAVAAGAGGTAVGGAMQRDVSPSQPPTRIPQEPTSPPPACDLQAVRELLKAAFSDEEILTLAFDRFRDVYEEISVSGMPKPEKIRRLVDWCLRNVHLETLLAETHKRNPAQYNRFKERLGRT